MAMARAMINIILYRLLSSSLEDTASLLCGSGHTKSRTSIGTNSQILFYRYFLRASLWVKLHWEALTVMGATTCP